MMRFCSCVGIVGMRVLHKSNIIIIVVDHDFLLYHSIGFYLRVAIRSLNSGVAKSIIGGGGGAQIHIFVLLSKEIICAEHEYAPPQKKKITIF